MTMYFTYRGHHLIGASTELWLMFETILSAPEGDYAIVLVEYGPEGKTPETGHLVFRGTRDDAGSVRWH